MGSTAERRAFVAAMLVNLALLPLAVGQATAAAGAQSYPVKPLRLIVPFPRRHLEQISSGACSAT